MACTLDLRAIRTTKARAPVRARSGRGPGKSPGALVIKDHFAEKEINCPGRSQVARATWGIRRQSGAPQGPLGHAPRAAARMPPKEKGRAWRPLWQVWRGFLAHRSHRGRVSRPCRRRVLYATSERERGRVGRVTGAPGFVPQEHCQLAAQFRPPLRMGGSREYTRKRLDQYRRVAAGKV